MGLVSLVAVVAIQLATLLLPLAAGLTGWVSGPVAGLASVTGWFVLGLPLSYGLLDARVGKRAPARQPKPLPPAALTNPIT